MSTCLVCSRRAQLYLCGHCTQRLHQYIDQLAWLLEEITVTTARQDRLVAGATGGSRSNDTIAAINFDALDTSTKARKVIIRTVRALLLPGEPFRPERTVPQWFIGPLLDGWERTHYVPTNRDYVDWLRTNRRRIPKSLLAGEIYRDIRDLVDEDQGDGLLVVAINRNERRYYGPCSHITGRDRHGLPRECGADIYGPRDADMVTCPECSVSVSAQNQLDQTEARSDLRTMDMLIDTMRNLGETVGRNRVQKWINAGQLQRRGYYNRDRGITKKRVRRGDPAVYSLKQARDLWAHQTRHQQKVSAK